MGRKRERARTHEEHNEFDVGRTCWKSCVGYGLHMEQKTCNGHTIRHRKHRSAHDGYGCTDTTHGM